MRHVILPVHGFHFSKVAKGHNIKEKATKIISIFVAFSQSKIKPIESCSQTNFSCFTYIRVTLRSLRKVSFYAFSASTILWKSIRLNASALLNSSSLRTSNT